MVIMLTFCGNAGHRTRELGVAIKKQLLGVLGYMVLKWLQTVLFPA